MVQFVLLYSAHYGKSQVIDLTQLVFGDSTYSRIVYFTGLTTSILSVCFSCTTMLKWGDSPVIESFFSFKFIKILSFILTKFLVQAYFLSMALKSLMYYEVFLEGENTTSFYYQVFNRNYNGICNKRYSIGVFCQKYFKKYF